MADLNGCIQKFIDAGQITEQMGLTLSHNVQGFTRQYSVTGKMSPQEDPLEQPNHQADD